MILTRRIFIRMMVTALLCHGPLLAGCDSADPAEDIQPQPLTGETSLEDSKAAVVTRYCYQAEACGCAAETSANCESDMETEWEQAVADAEQLGLTFDGACLTKRLNALMDRTCAESAPSSFDAGETCLIFHGTLAAGEFCNGGQSYSNCAQGLTCKGVCFDRNTVPKDGDPCADQVGMHCDDGLVCDSITALCKPLPTLGETCEEGCVAPFFCDAGATNTCVDPKPDSESCTSQASCASGICENGKCEPAPGVGEPCRAICGEGLRCVQQTCEAAGPAVCDDHGNLID